MPVLRHQWQCRNWSDPQGKTSRGDLFYWNVRWLHSGDHKPHNWQKWWCSFHDKKPPEFNPHKFAKLLPNAPKCLVWKSDSFEPSRPRHFPSPLTWHKPRSPFHRSLHWSEFCGNTFGYAIVLLFDPVHDWHMPGNVWKKTKARTLKGERNLVFLVAWVKTEKAVDEGSCNTTPKPKSKMERSLSFCYTTNGGMAIGAKSTRRRIRQAIGFVIFGIIEHTWLTSSPRVKAPLARYCMSWCVACWVLAETRPQLHHVQIHGNAKSVRFSLFATRHSKKAFSLLHIAQFCCLI